MECSRGYTIEEEKNPSTFTFDYTSQSDVNGIVNELTLPEVNAVFMHGLFRAWEFSLIDIISEKTPVGWIIWGGDLYKPLKNNQKNKIPAQKLAYILTPVKGDSDTFQAEFGDKPWFDFAYPYPGLYGDIELSAPQNKTKKLLVGNSGDPSNNHIDVLNMLAAKKDIEEYQVIMRWPIILKRLISNNYFNILRSLDWPIKSLCTRSSSCRMNI